MQNLRLFNRMDINEEEVTELYLPDVEARVSLFNYLNDLKDITQEKLLKGFFHLKKPSGKDSQFALRWNYVEDKVYPCNETRYVFLAALKRAKMKAEWLTPERELHLWHLLYSVDDRADIIKALTHWAEREQLSEEWVESQNSSLPEGIWCLQRKSHQKIALRHADGSPLGRAGLASQSVGQLPVCPQR